MQSWNPVSQCLADGHQLVLQHLQEWEMQPFLRWPILQWQFEILKLSVPEPRYTFLKLLVLCSSSTLLHYKVFSSPSQLPSRFVYITLMPPFLTASFPGPTLFIHSNGEQIFRLLGPKCGTNRWPNCFGRRTAIVCRMCRGFIHVICNCYVFHQLIKPLTFKALLGNQKSATFP